MEIDLTGVVPWAVSFLLVVGRLSGLFLLAPVFSSRMIPVRVKAMALMTVSAMLTPIVAHGAVIPVDSALPLLVLMVKEVTIGLALGFSVSVIFAAIQTGASMIDTSVGFSLANLFDPATSSQGSVFGSFCMVLGG